MPAVCPYCRVTKNSRWVLIDVMVRNQNDEKVATGEAMVEFPLTERTAPVSSGAAPPVKMLYGAESALPIHGRPNGS